MNNEEFGEHSEKVKKWMIKHEMAWMMPELKELFDSIKEGG